MKIERQIADVPGSIRGTANWDWYRYYGTYNGSVVFGHHGPDPEEYDIIAETIFGLTPKIFVWKDGKFYRLKEASNLGLLTKPDIRNIAYFYNLGEMNLENHAGIYYYDIHNSIWSYYNTYINIGLPLSSFDSIDNLGVWIENFYGSYNTYIDNSGRTVQDCLAIMMNIPREGNLDDVPWEETIILSNNDHEIFNYNNSNRILIYKWEESVNFLNLEVPGTFYELQEAYNKGFLTDDDIRSIAYYHKTGKTIRYRYPRSSSNYLRLINFH